MEFLLRAVTFRRHMDPLVYTWIQGIFKMVDLNKRMYPKEVEYSPFRLNSDGPRFLVFKTCDVYRLLGEGKGSQACSMRSFWASLPPHCRKTPLSAEEKGLFCDIHASVHTLPSPQPKLTNLKATCFPVHDISNIWPVWNFCFQSRKSYSPDRNLSQVSKSSPPQRTTLQTWKKRIFDPGQNGWNIVGSGESSKM